MLDDEDESEIVIAPVKQEEPVIRKPKKIKIPRREESVVIPEPRVLVMTAGIKPKPIKLAQCQVSPLTLYELCAAIVDKMDFPDPFGWDEDQVADWMENVVGFPQYRACIIDNHINGRRLLRLEDASVLPEINIHDFQHIKKITAAIRKIFATDYVLFARSLGLPIRKPLTHSTWFKSRTGPTWGIRQNWTRSDVLRWMKILMPKPLHLDHWDLVWYQKPEWPKVVLSRIPQVTPEPINFIPHYEPVVCNEYLTPRKFRLQENIPEKAQFIWMEHLPGSALRQEPKKKEEDKRKKSKGKISGLLPKNISLTGLKGKDFILARRQMPKPKFLA